MASNDVQIYVGIGVAAGILYLWGEPVKELIDSLVKEAPYAAAAAFVIITAGLAGMFRFAIGFSWLGLGLSLVFAARAFGLFDSKKSGDDEGYEYESDTTEDAQNTTKQPVLTQKSAEDLMNEALNKKIEEDNKFWGRIGR